jgi:hypothetical protein
MARLELSATNADAMEYVVPFEVGATDPNRRSRASRRRPFRAHSPAVTLDIRPPNDYRRVCAFCGACDEMSREHVFPQWMADLLRGDQPGQFQMARHPHRATPTTWQTVKPDTKAPIGKRCNSEWMSDLETATQAYLKKLVRRDRARVTLSMAAQDRLALWITKTVLMAGLAQSQCPIPAATYRAVYDNRQPPQHARIWLAAYSGGLLIHDRSATLLKNRPGLGPDDIGGPDDVGGYVTTMALGRLVFQMAHTFDVDPEVEKHAPDVLLVPIWPRQGRSQFWPAGSFDGEDAINDAELLALAARFAATTIH